VQINSPQNPPDSAPSESEDSLAFSPEIEASRERIAKAVDKVATEAMRVEVVLPSPLVSALKEKEVATMDTEEQVSDLLFSLIFAFHLLRLVSGPCFHYQKMSSFLSNCKSCHSYFPPLKDVLGSN